MAKVSGSFKSLIRGVSEQVAHDRLDGQHYEQVNMISDPIRGLARRRGSKFCAEVKLQAGRLPNEADIQDITRFREYSFSRNGTDYCLLYRPDRKVSGSGVEGMFCYDKDGKRFLPIQIDPRDDTIQAIFDGGISAITSIGDYLAIAGRYQKPRYDTKTFTNQRTGNGVVWIRGGANARTYSVTVTTEDGKQISASYTTMKSYYDKILDTSDIKATKEDGTTDPDYQKKLNDRVNEYSSKVNAHIAEAAADIQPESIAENLARALRNAGLDGTARTIGAHIVMSRAYALTADDGGNGEFIRAVAQQVAGTEELTEVHYVGKTVQVSPKDSDPYYLRAEPRNAGETEWAQVVWREAAGTQYTPTFVFAVGTIDNGTFKVASNNYYIEQVLGRDAPEFVPSSCGDENTSPLPKFMNGYITHMDTFQDRLVICTGGTVFMSRSSDYFNFFRKSVLTVEDDDPIEMYAIGSEGDSIVSSVFIDRNYILFGQQHQYAISGRDIMTPRTAYLAVQSSHEEATDARPVSLGNLVFFGQYRNGSVAVQQMMTGAYADTFDSVEVTQQLSRYLRGQPMQLLATTAPNMLFLRTYEEQNAIYVYSFLDSSNGGERVFDAWSKWAWDKSLGPVAAISKHSDSVLVFTARTQQSRLHLVCDEFSRDADLSEAPHLDSWSQYAQPSYDGTGRALNTLPMKVALGTQHKNALIGGAWDKASELVASVGAKASDLYMGYPFEAYFEPTSPYLRDRNDRAILDGRLTVAFLTYSLYQSSALRVHQGRRAPDNLIKDYLAMELGSSAFTLGAVPIRDVQVRIPVGRETGEYRMRVSARDWLPLTITSIEWVGQAFIRRRS